MAFKMNSSRISLRGSADTPGSFSTNHTANIISGPGMGAQAPVGPGSQGEAMSNMNDRPVAYFTDPKDKVNDGNVEVTKDKIPGQAQNVEVTIPAGSTTQTTGKKAPQKPINNKSNSLNEVIITKNLTDKKQVRNNYSRGGQTRSLENSNYNARNVMTPKQKKAMDLREGKTSD